MKQKEKQTIVSATIPEIQKQVGELKEALARLIRNRYTKPSKNVREAKAIRYKITYLQTVQQIKTFHE